MSSDTQEPDNLTAITRTWRLGGPLSAVQRKEAKALFLEELKRVHNVSFACEHAVISRQTAYTWRDQDEKFAEAWENAVERSKDMARMSIFQRGILGWDEPLVSQGQPVYEYEFVLDERGNQMIDSKGRPVMKRGALQTIHKWSDSLAMGYAKANLPEYKDKQQIDLTAQITTMAEHAKDELLADLAVAITNEDKEQTHTE